MNWMVFLLLGIFIAHGVHVQKSQLYTKHIVVVTKHSYFQLSIGHLIMPSAKLL